MRVLVLAVVAALALAAGAYAAHDRSTSTATFGDIAGDAGTAADIGSVTASVDASQQVTFRVGLTGPRGVISLFIDADGNPATGGPQTGGADFAVDYDESQRLFYFSRWTGSEWNSDIPYSTVHVSESSSDLTFSVNRSELPGAADHFKFWVGSIESWDRAGDGQSDEAPDTGTYAYAFGALQLSLASFKVVALKGEVVAAAVGTRSDTGAFLGSEGSVTCKATVGKRALPIVSTGVLLAGKEKTPVATCVFSVPKALHGKLAQGQMSIGVDGVWLLKSFTSKLK